MKGIIQQKNSFSKKIILIGDHFMKILFVYPSSDTTVSIYSVIAELKKKGHDLEVLAFCEKGDLHNDLEKIKIKCTFFNPKKYNTLLYYLKHILLLTKHIKKNKIDLVFSHIQKSNFISSITGLFVSSRVVLCRHHSDYVFNSNNKTEKVFDRIINLLGKEFIAPSNAVYRQMVEKENVSPRKIHLIDYGYDFSLFPAPDEMKVKMIQAEVSAKFTLIMVGRLIPLKRQKIMIRAMPMLIKDHKLDISLQILGDGPDFKMLREIALNSGVDNRILFRGHKKNVLDYMAASDLLIHISESEASNGVVKEAIMVNLPVLICRNVGDFDDYANSRNALLLNKDFIDEELIETIKYAYYNKSAITKLAHELNNAIHERFDINKVINKYDIFMI